MRFQPQPHRHERYYAEPPQEESSPPIDEEAGQSEAAPPSFNVPEESIPSAPPDASGLRRYQPSLAERVLPGKQGRQSPVTPQAQVVARANQGIRQAIGNQVKRVTSKIAARVAGSAVGGPVAWALAVGSTVKDAVSFGWTFLSSKWSTTIVLLIIFGFTWLLVASLFAAIQGKNNRGPDLSGARANQPLSSESLAAMAAGERGIVAANNLEDLQQIRTNLKNYISGNQTSLSSEARSSAAALFSQMEALEQKMQASSYATNTKAMAEHIEAYKKLLNDIYTIVFPSAAAPRARVVAFLDSGTIRSNEYCRGTENDLRSGPLSPTLLSLVAEMGNYATTNGFTVTLSCAKAGHGGKTLHFRGRAVDIQVTSGDNFPDKLMPFLFDNRERLQIAELVFNAPFGGNPAGYYNFDTFPAVQRRPIGNGHLTHIHIGVRK